MKTNLLILPLARTAGGDFLLPAIVLPAPETMQQDEIGNVTFSWQRPKDDFRRTVAPLLSRNVQQQRTRNSQSLIVVADSGAQLVRVTWNERVVTGNLGPREALGVITSPTLTLSLSQLQRTVVLYVCNFVHTRDGQRLKP